MSDSQAENLARTLLSVVDPAACAACLDTLEAYVGDQRAGRDYAALHPTTAHHLDACVECAEAYALLYDLAELPAAALPTPARIPPPDLSFLSAAAAAKLAELLRSALTHTGNQVRVQLSPTLITAGRAIPPSMAYRDAGTPALFTLAISDPTPAITQLQISAHATSTDASRCTLQAQITLPDRDWPDLAGINVRAVGTSGTLNAQTDAWGVALFTDLPTADLETLVIEVEP